MSRLGYKIGCLFKVVQVVCNSELLLLAFAEQHFSQPEFFPLPQLWHSVKDVQLIQKFCGCGTSQQKQVNKSNLIQETHIITFNSVAGNSGNLWQNQDGRVIVLIFSYVDHDNLLYTKIWSSGHHASLVYPLPKQLITV